MNESPREHPPETTARKVKRSKNGPRIRRTALGAKIALIAAIVWLGVSNTRALLAWRAGAAAPSRTDDAAQEGLPPLPDVPAEATQVMGMLQDGDWQFAGATWRVGVASVNADALEQLLSERPAEVEQSLGLDPETSQSLLNALRLQGGKVTQQGGVSRIATNQPTSRMVAYYQSTAEGDVVLGGRMAWPEEGATWKVISCRPAPHASANATGGSGGQGSLGDHPPSLPEGASLMATRRSPEGAVLGQVYEAVSPRATLIDHWRREGWRVESLAGPQAASHVERLPAATARVLESRTLLLSRDQLSYAATVRDGDAGPTIVLLARCDP